MRIPYPLSKLGSIAYVCLKSHIVDANRKSPVPLLVEPEELSQQSEWFKIRVQLAHFCCHKSPCNSSWVSICVSVDSSHLCPELDCFQSDSECFFVRYELHHLCGDSASVERQDGLIINIFQYIVVHESAFFSDLFNGKS